MTTINTNISIITLNINSLNYLIKRHRPNRPKSEISLARVYKKHSFKSRHHLTKTGWWQADRPSYHSRPEPRLWVSLVQHSPHLWATGLCGGAKSADPKLQNLHDTEQWQESQWGPFVNGVAEARGLKPFQRILTRKDIWTKGLYYVTH